MREWLVGIVGEDGLSKATPILAFAFVILLVLVLFWLARKVFSGTGRIGSRSRAPRLAVLDVTSIDPKRKLVLVRRDETEHLLLIGGQNDLVVEANILRAPLAAAGSTRGARADPQMRLERGRSDVEPMTAAELAGRRTPVPSVPVGAAPQVPRRPTPPPPRAQGSGRERRNDPYPGHDGEDALGDLPAAPLPHPPPLAAEPELGPRRVDDIPLQRARAEPAMAEPVTVRPIPVPIAEPVAQAGTTEDVPGSAAPVVPEGEAPPVIDELPRRPSRDVVPANRLAEPEPVEAESGEASAPPVEAPARMAPAVSVQPRIEPPTVPVRHRTPTASQPTMPRSMATPTLPHPARPSVPSAPEVPLPAVGESAAMSAVGRSPRVESRTASENTVGPESIPAVQAPARDERLSAAAPDSRPAPRADTRGTGERSADLAREGGAANTEALPAGPAAEAEIRPPAPEPSVERAARQPLSVRSFASTIQAARAPAAPAAAPAAKEATPAAIIVPPKPSEPLDKFDVDDSLADLLAAEFAPVSRNEADDAEPTPARQEGVAVVPEPDVAETPEPPSPPARALSLEEEMERLLKDFTVGVSHRR